MRTQRILKLLGGFYLIAVLLIVIATPASAVEFRTGGDVTIASGEVIDDDLYVSAANFTLNGTVKGDLLVTGATVTIGPEGVVEGDFMSGAQSISIDGSVGDDARVAGAVIVVGETAQFGDDLVGAGYSLETKPGSIVQGSLLFAGGQALLAGEISENVKTSVGGMKIDGMVGGDVEAEVGSPEDLPPFSPLMFMPNVPPVPSVPGGLTIGQNAQVEGDLTYTAIEDTSLPAGAIAGAVTRREPELKPEEVEQPPTAAKNAADWGVKTLRSFLTLLLVGLLLVWLVPGFIRQTSDILKERPLPSFGWGLVSFLGFFLVITLLALAVGLLAVVLGLVTLGGLLRASISVGIFTITGLVLAFSIATTLLSKVIVSYFGGRWIATKIKSDWTESKFWPLFIGLIIFVLLVSIPILGTAINYLVILFGLGGLILLLWGWLRPPPAEVEQIIN